MGWRDILDGMRSQTLARRGTQDEIADSEPLLIRPGEYAAPVSEVDAHLDKTRVDTDIYGATGTPILSGFVTDLQEYNPDLRGRSAITTYEKMRRSDGDVASLLKALKLPIQAAEFKIVPGVESNEPEYGLAKELAEFVEDNLFGGLEYTNSLGVRFSQRFDSVIDNALLCLDYGCSGYEDIWSVDQDKVRLKRMGPRLPMTYYRFHVDEDGETLRGVEQWGYRGANFVNVVVPADKFNLFVLRQEGANFYGRGVLREAYQHWFIKNALYRIDSIACERNAAGVPVIVLGPQASIEDKNQAYQFVQNISVHEAMGLVLPNGSTFELVATKGRPREVLPSIQHHSEMICRSGLAMFMTLGTTQSGARSLGNTMVDFFQLAEEAVGGYVCDQMSEGTIRRICDYNFYRGEGKALPYPRLQIPNIMVLNPIEMLSVIKDVADNKVDLVQPDDETENYIRKKLGFPLKGITRPRYAPVVERIQEEGSGNPAADEAAGEKSGEPGQRSASPGGKTSGQDPQEQKIQDQKERNDAKKSGDPQATATKRDTPQSQFDKSGKSPAPQDTSKKVVKANYQLLTRELRPEEKKHNFEGHVKRQDSTQTSVRRVLNSAKVSMIHTAARKAADLDPKTLDHLTLPFNHQLVGRVANSVGLAYKYGYDQVYAERYRANKRPKKELPHRVALSERKLHYSQKWQGLSVSIENAAGSLRKARDGSWQTKMKFPYGYIQKTMGADGEHIDCYIGPDRSAEHVYVVHQNDPNTGLYDEDKVMLDFSSEDEARKGYLAHRDDDARALGAISKMTVASFKKALKTNGGKLHFKKTGDKAVLLAEKSAEQDRPGLIAQTSISDLNNWITGRTRGSAVDNWKKGLRDKELEEAIINDILEGSDAYLDRIAAEAARSGVAGGRYQALEELKDEIASYTRSEAMDQNTCDSCAAGDGMEWESLADVDWSPGDDCDGADACRGQLMPIFKDEGTVELG